MSTQQPGAPAPLPELSAQRVDEIEEALFADIARERDAATVRRARRGRLWLAGGAAAAVIAVAAIIAPSIGPLVSGSGGTADGSAIAPADEFGDAGGGVADSPVEMHVPDVSTESSETSARDTSLEEGTTDRDIITTASASVRVDDVEAAARTISDAAIARGGYVESMNLTADGAPSSAVDPSSGVAYDTMPYPYPQPPGNTWISVRVPSDQLTGLVDELAEVGEVAASSVNRQDVTEQTVDLAARIEAAQASVDRLTSLMAQAESVADLIAAESALSERQGLLESYQQQLEMLETQVAMSTLTVTLTPEIETVTADPAGFGDGLVAGWNGLVATLNGVVVALGFLLPWLAVAAVVVLIVWGIVRVVRRRRQRRTDAAARPAAGPPQPRAPGDASE